MKTCILCYWDFSSTLKKSSIFKYWSSNYRYSTVLCNMQSYDFYGLMLFTGYQRGHQIKQLLLVYHICLFQVISTFARHYKTGEPLSEEAVNNMCQSKKLFNASVSRISHSTNRGQSQMHKITIQFKDYHICPW